MKTFSFHVKTQVVTETGELSAVYFRIRKGHVARTVEHADGRAFADYSVAGKLLGIELIAPCKITVLDSILSAQEREPIKKFIRKASPRELVLT
jgi:uncharacterized protein YuzE